MKKARRWNVSVCIDDPTYWRVAQYAAEQRISKSEAMRRLLKIALDKTM